MSRVFLALITLFAAACASSPPIVSPGPPAAPTPLPTSASTHESSPPATATPATTPPSPAPSPLVRVSPTLARTATAPSPSPATLGQELVEPGVLRVCTAVVGAPATALGETGDLGGYNIDVARELGERLELTVEFRRAPFTVLLAMVAAHDCDIAVASHNITAARRESATFVPYTRSEQPVVVRLGDPEHVDSPRRRSR